MSYWDIAEMAQDIDLQARIYAAGAQERVDVNGKILRICSAPGWGEAWASAVAGDLESPGRHEDVISDSMILASVREIAAEET